MKRTKISLVQRSTTVAVERLRTLLRNHIDRIKRSYPFIFTVFVSQKIRPSHQRACLVSGLPELTLNDDTLSVPLPPSTTPTPFSASLSYIEPDLIESYRSKSIPATARSCRDESSSNYCPAPVVSSYSQPITHSVELNEVDSSSVFPSVTGKIRHQSSSSD